MTNSLNIELGKAKHEYIELCLKLAESMYEYDEAQKQIQELQNLFNDTVAVEVRDAAQNHAVAARKYVELLHQHHVQKEFGVN